MNVNVFIDDDVIQDLFLLNLNFIVIFILSSVGLNYSYVILIKEKSMKEVFYLIER